jgi:hypothetical protein
MKKSPHKTSLWGKFGVEIFPWNSSCSAMACFECKHIGKKWVFLRSDPGFPGPNVGEKAGF